VALKSPIASGKTELIIRLIQSGTVGRVLYVTHLESLNTNAAERFNSARITFESYNSIPSEYSLSAIKYLTCSINSIHRIGKNAKYDLIVFDEIEQALSILWSNTMKDNEALENHDILKSILSGAG